jgi:hypothetical protein
MKHIKLFKYLILSIILAGYSFGQDSTKAQTGKELGKHQKGSYKKFIDVDGDGYNDTAPDHDGDGIPNGIDPDYIKMNKRERNNSLEFIDSNGDGINDNLQFNNKGRKREFYKNRFKNQLIPQNTDEKKNIENGRKKYSKGKG